MKALTYKFIQKYYIPFFLPSSFRFMRYTNSDSKQTSRRVIEASLFHQYCKFNKYINLKKTIQWMVNELIVPLKTMWCSHWSYPSEVVLSDKKVGNRCFKALETYVNTLSGQAMYKNNKNYYLPLGIQYFSQNTYLKRFFFP